MCAKSRASCEYILRAHSRDAETRVEIHWWFAVLANVNKFDVFFFFFFNSRFCEGGER